MNLLCVGKNNHEKVVVNFKDFCIGGEDFVIIAGPCSIESEKMIIDTSLAVKKCGASIVWGGAFKPRTSPYDFQGLGDEGLRYLKKASEFSKPQVVSEIMDPRDMEQVY